MKVAALSHRTCGINVTFIEDDFIKLKEKKKALMKARGLTKLSWEKYIWENCMK